MTTLSIKARLRKPLNRMMRDGGGHKQTWGYIQGIRASADEMIFGKALSRAGIDYQFFAEVYTEFTVLGQENQIDFILYLPTRTVAVEVDGEFSHRTVVQKMKDRQRDLLLGSALQKMGIDSQIVRLETKRYLKDDQTATKTVRELFL